MAINQFMAQPTTQNESIRWRVQRNPSDATAIVHNTQRFIDVTRLIAHDHTQRSLQCSQCNHVRLSARNNTYEARTTPEPPII